jgi:hypothetical protein
MYVLTPYLKGRLHGFYTLSELPLRSEFRAPGCKGFFLELVPARKFSEKNPGLLLSSKNARRYVCIELN